MSFGGTTTAQPSIGFGTGNSTSAFGTKPTGFSTGFGSANTSGFGSSGFNASSTTGPALSGFGTNAPSAGMSFGSGMGFGTTGSTGFGSSATTGFGPSATTTTGFGSSGSAFGTGNTGLGTPQTGFGSTSGGFGAGFGASTTTFGGATNKTMGFGSSSGGFGQSLTAPTFGTNTLGQASNNTPNTTAGFGSSGFGSSTGITKLGFGGFGGQPSSGGFGSQPASSGFGTSLGGFGAGFGINPSAGASAMGTTSFGNTIVQDQSQGIEQKIIEIQRSYASVVDSTGRYLVEPPSQMSSAGALGTTTSSFGGLGSAAAMGSVQTIPNVGCQFDTIVYNPISNPNQPSARPAHVGYQRWRQAELANPDPQLFEPCLLIGPSALKKRFEEQRKSASEHAQVMQEVSQTLALSAQAVAKTEKRSETLRDSQAKLRHRLLTVMCKIEVLRCRGVHIDPNERRFRDRLDEIAKQLRGPQQLLQQLMALQNQLMNELGSTADVLEGLDEADLAAVHQAIERQQEGLRHLVDIVNKDSRDVAIVAEKIAEIRNNPALQHALDDFYKRI